MPRGKQKHEATQPEELKLLQTWHNAVLYHFCAALEAPEPSDRDKHSSALHSEEAPEPSDRDKHSRRLSELVSLAHGRVGNFVRVTWPNMSEDEVISECEGTRRNLAPLSESIPDALQKLARIAKNPWPPVDDLVNHFASLDRNKLLPRAKQRLEELNRLDSTDLNKFEQQVSQLEKQGGLNCSSMKDLQSWIAWVAELALLLKLTAVYLAWLYLGYVFAAYISFIYRFGKVFGAMEKSGEKLSSFISREDGLLDDWWRTELRPNLVDLSHEVNSSIMLRPENDALVEFAEARLGLGGDMQRAMGILWDLGVRGGGRPLTWEDIVTPRIVEAVVQVDEKVQDSLCLVLETLCDYEGRTDLGHILEEGAKGKLLNILKKATWHDRLDKAKKSKAKKRQSTVIPFSQLVKSLGDASEELTPEELASRIAEIDPDAAYGAIDAKLTLGQLAQSPDLTDREREAFLLAVALAEANGEVSTYQEIGRHMGVTKGTAKKLLDRAYEKLRKHALRD